ncbi:MAG: FAD-dependent thymidylate synthase [Gemmatimonadota bacterium]
MRLRQVNEDTLAIRHTRVVDVYRNGPKPVFRMILSDGKRIEATADHRFLFADGWKTLRAATGLCEKGGRAVWRSGENYLYVNGVEVELPSRYRDREWLDTQYNALGRTAAEIAEECGCTEHTIRKWIRRHTLQGRNDRGRFRPGHTPWNKGTTYVLGPRELSAEWRAANRRARSGSASNFWKGGISDRRDSIGRWTTQIALKIHRRNDWTCQLCHRRATELHCHHVVPVWADASLAGAESNLTTLCGPCHRRIQGRELVFVERLGGRPVRAEWVKRPAVPRNKLTRAKLVRIERFEFVGHKETYDLEVEGPFHNLIANGIVTHNSVNEYSGRYSLMPLLFYKPEFENFALQSTASRQGREAAASRETYVRAIERWETTRGQASETYGWLVGQDVARELARIDLPLSTYTQWYWKIDLHNLFHFLTLRVDPHAQWEIREYGRVIAGILKRVAPLSYEAWLDYEVAGTHLSHAEVEVLRHLLEVAEGGLRPRVGAEALSAERLAAFGLSGREVRELLAKLQPAERPDFDLDLGQMRPPEEFEARMREAVPGDFE